MRLNLIYRGTGLAVKGSASEKHAIRRHFHGQIARFWASDNRLKTIDRGRLGLCVKGAQFQYDVQRSPDGTIPFIPENPLSAFMFRLPLLGMSAIPLVTEAMGAECHLRIRIGRPVRPGKIIFTGGDLDGRLKTLFDALRMPQCEQELPAQSETEGDVMCLLADDSLITRLVIEPYEILEDHPSDKYVELDVEADIHAVVPMNGTAALLW